MKQISECIFIDLPNWPYESGPLPRELRTPHTDASAVVANLDDWWAKEFKQPEGNFIAEIFSEIWHRNDNPDDWIRTFNHRAEVGENVLAVVPLIPAAMCVQAFKAHTRGEISIAWSYVVDAESWWGTLSRGDVAIEARRMALSNKARAAATVRHRENRSMKSDVFNWLDTNMINFKSMDAAAEEIAGKIAPIVFRTARDWVTEWKKLRSASTP